MLGRYRSADSLVEASGADLRQVIVNYLLAHFVVARTFLPGLVEHGGTYVFINGPLAWDPWEGSGLVSTATAGQYTSFQAFNESHATVANS